MGNKIFLVFGLAMSMVAISCKQNTSNHMGKVVVQDSTLVGSAATNILRYKVKEEYHQKDSISLTFRGIYLKKVDQNEYHLKIKAETDPFRVKYHKDYYMIISIYPRDKDLALLKKERRKYGFEAFSTKVRKDSDHKLLIARTIKTKINFARAITVSVMEYKTNKKSSVVVMKNVDLNKL